MAISPWTGWAISSFLMYKLGKNNNGMDEQAEAKPDELSVQETPTGKPVPVVIGRTLLKSPLTIYYGDFRAEAYTEEYAAHANFSAWPIILTGLLDWLLKPKTGQTADDVNKHEKDKHTHNIWVTGQATLHQEPSGEHGHDIKETEGPNYLMLLATWLLSWLINGRNLKTTIQKGFKYYLGFQQLLCCSGKGVRLKTIYMDKTKVWEGNAVREDYPNGPLVIKINDDDLFGGVDEGGGFVGELHVYLGGDNQMPDEWMVQQMKADSIPTELRGLTPAYRDFVSVVVPTAYVGKRATIPEIWYEVEWIPDSLGLAPIDGDANPAEVLHEIVVNRRWGLCEPMNGMDIDSMKAMGAKLAEEKMGISLKLENKTAAKNLIDTICDHINAVRYNSPDTGKLTYKLIRDDYDPFKAFLLDVDNCASVKMSRMTWQETIGKVSVTFTDRSAQYEENSIGDSDPANVVINEGIRTDKSYSMLYFTNSANALWVAKRELRQQGYPLAAFTIVGNRKLSALRMGDVVRLVWKPLGIENMLLRVTKVDIGDFVEGKVTIEALEDVFSLDKTDLDFSGGTGWNPEIKYPTGVQDYQFMEMPYEMIPEKSSSVFAMAARPTEDTVRWTVWRQRDGKKFESTSSMTRWTAAARLVYDYKEFSPVEDVVGIEVINIYGLDWLHDDTPTSGAPDITAARKGSKILGIGDELMAWSGIQQMPNGHWKITGILRGVHDTVPQFHQGGELIFFIEAGTYANVTTGGPVTEEGKTVVECYNITTASVDKEEEFNYTKTKYVETVRRPERPNAPGHFRMSDFGAQCRYFMSTAVGNMSFAWVQRNKEFSYGAVSQDDSAEYFTHQPFKEIDGLEYLIKIYVGGIWAANYTTKDKTWTYSWQQRCLDSKNVLDKTRIEVYSKVGDLVSFQPQVRTWQWNAPVLVNGCIDQEVAFRQLFAWDIEDRVVIPAGKLCDTERQVMHWDMPVILLGVPCAQDTSGAIACWDGSYMMATGKMLIVTGKWQFKVTDLVEGYTIQSWFVPQASGGRVYYRWNGKNMDMTLAD